MAFVAITIARRVGAGGATLGQRLAKRLGYLYLDRAIIQEAAEQMGGNEADLANWEERVPQLWERVLHVFAVGPPEAIYTPRPLPGPRVWDRQLFKLESQIIQKAAAEQNVVVIGRCAAWILRKHPGLVSVYLHAPRRMRVPEVMQAYGVQTEREAAALIDRLDWERERFVQRMTGEMLGEASCYDLCMDMGRVGMELAEEMVVQLVERVQEQIAPDKLRHSGLPG